MPAISSSFDENQLDWHHIHGEHPFGEYELDYEYSLLGYDVAGGKLDMMMRFKPGSSYCERHRHLCATTTVVLRGEQHLEERQPDGSIRQIVRKAGDYAIAPPDALAHMETGGPEGALFLLSLSTGDGMLFEALDADYNVLMTVNIEEMVARWEARHEEQVA